MPGSSPSVPANGTRHATASTETRSSSRPHNSYTPLGRRRGNAEGAKKNVETGRLRWLLTYSDMITSLLALFVVMFSTASVNRQRFQWLGAGLRQSLHTEPPPHTKTTVGPAKNATGHPETPAVRQHLKPIEAQLEKALVAHRLQHDVQLHDKPRGLIARLVATGLFFANDSAELSPTGQQVLRIVGQTAAPLPNAVIAEGYTNSLSIVGGPHNSNRPLSAARASSVVGYLDHAVHLNPRRLAAIGYGSSRPLVPNTSPVNLARNRRVNVAILRSASPVL